MHDGNPSDVSAPFRSVAAQIFLSSGPWGCGTGTSSGAGACRTLPVAEPRSGVQLYADRFGAVLLTASSPPLRPQLKLHGNFTSGLGRNFHRLPRSSQHAMANTLNLSGPCGRFQQGIGQTQHRNTVGLNQVTIATSSFPSLAKHLFDWQTTRPSESTPSRSALRGINNSQPSLAVGCPRYGLLAR